MLTDDDQALLDFESRPWPNATAKEVRAHEELGLSATRYYARLRWLERSPDAEAAYPVLVHGLRRQREIRRLARDRQALTG